jgi:uncharacterized C2H2 Zn-finger protein
MEVWKLFYDINETSNMKVEITVEADDVSYEPTLAAITNLTEELGVPTSISKHLKFDDLGLASMDNGEFQCLACSKTFKFKASANRHYKNMHAYQNQSQLVQCPRCNDEMFKSDLNSHMETKHGVENFDQMMKRSFKPPITPENLAKKVPKKKIKRDPIRRDLIKRELFKRDPIKRDLSNLTQDVWQEDYNNNIVTIEDNEQNSKTNIKNEFNIVKIEENLEDSKTNIKYELDEKPGTFEGYHRTIFAPDIKSENVLIHRRSTLPVCID